MKNHLRVVKCLNYIVRPLFLAAALASVGCVGEAAESASPSYDGNILAEVKVGTDTRIVFVDEGEGMVGVAEMSSAGRPSIVTAMMTYENATPLEIFLATAEEGRVAPALLIQNHHELAALQGREDFAPREPTLLEGKREALLESLAYWSTDGTTPCTESGWETGTGVWANPVDSWDNIFTNDTDAYVNNTTYPRAKSITQLVAWNGGSGSYHSHGVCLNNDTGDDQIYVAFYKGGFVFGKSLVENNGDNWVIYNDWVSVNGTITQSSVTNGRSGDAATFRQSAAAWVPNPQ